MDQNNFILTRNLSNDFLVPLFNHIYCAPPATWWLLRPLTALSVTSYDGHLATSYHVFQLSISSVRLAFQMFLFFVL